MRAPVLLGQHRILETAEAVHGDPFSRLVQQEHPVVAGRLPGVWQHRVAADARVGPRHPQTGRRQPGRQVVVLRSPAVVEVREAVGAVEGLHSDGQRAAGQRGVRQLVAEAADQDGEVPWPRTARVHVPQVLGQQVHIVQHHTVRGRVSHHLGHADVEQLTAVEREAERLLHYVDVVVEPLRPQEGVYVAEEEPQLGGAAAVGHHHSHAVPWRTVLWQADLQRRQLSVSDGAEVDRDGDRQWRRRRAEGRLAGDRSPLKQVAQKLLSRDVLIVEAREAERYAADGESEQQEAQDEQLPRLIRYPALHPPPELAAAASEHPWSGNKTC